MPRFHNRQDESLPLSEDPSGRGGGMKIRRYSKRQATVFEAACAAHQGTTVATYRRQGREASRAAQEREDAREPVPIPEPFTQDHQENLQTMRRLAQESRERWLEMTKRANAP